LASPDNIIPHKFSARSILSFHGAEQGAEFPRRAFSILRCQWTRISWSTRMNDLGGRRRRVRRGKPRLRRSFALCAGNLPENENDDEDEFGRRTPPKIDKMEISTLPTPVSDSFSQKPMVFSKDIAQAFVGQGEEGIVVNAFHRFRCDQGVDDRLLCGLRDGGQQGVQFIVSERGPLLTGPSRYRHRGRERDEQIARRIGADATGPCHAKRCAFREPF
jgi:hypothetical protein